MISGRNPNFDMTEPRRLSHFSCVAKQIDRPPLLDALEEARIRPFTLIAAPAGSGKTALASLWQRDLRMRGRAVPWITLRAEDDDKKQFVTRIARELQNTLPHAASPLRWVTGPPFVDADTVLRVILDVLRRTERETYLFLDDFHLILNPAIHAVVDQLIRAAPRHFHLVLVARRPSNFLSVLLDQAVEAIGTPSPSELLAPRELAVLRLLAEGHTNKQVARELDIRPETVKSHLKHIYGKLGVDRRLQAVLKAQGLGLLPIARAS